MYLAIIVFILASQEVVAVDRLLANRLSHRQHFHHHAHSVPPAEHAHTASLASNSHTVTPTSRFLTFTIESASRHGSHTATHTSHPTSSKHVSTTKPFASQPTTISTSLLTPNGIKAGIAGGDAYPFFKDHIGWWYDWSPSPSKPGKPIGVPMLWGAGTADLTDAARLAAFKKISTPPLYVLAYEEPDCPAGSGSAGMSVSSGVLHYESLIVPLGKKGSIIVSPSMCKQADETWLAQFAKEITREWDITAIHINKNNLDGVKKDIDYYWNTYKRPLWVTEFACVNDKDGFAPCTDQDEINIFINEVVPHFQSDDRVFAYAYSNGLGLGDVWPLMKDRSLSESGQTYFAAIKRYH